MSGFRSGALAIFIPAVLALSACGSSKQTGGAAAGSCHYLVVGRSGAIACSADGSAWSTRKSGTDQDLHGVAVSLDGTVVAVGASGTVLYSSDGAGTFHVATAPTSSDLDTVAVDDQEHFVIGGNDPHAYYSDDGGKSWTAGKAIDATSNLLIRSIIADGSGRFLAAGTYYVGSASGVDYRSRVYLSTDGGNTWSTVFDRDLSSNGGSIEDGLMGIATDGAHHYVTVAGKGQAYFVSGAPTSTWKASSGLGTNVQMDAVAWDAGNARFVAGDLTGTLYSSSDDGQSFSVGCAPLPGQSSVSSIAVGGGRLLAVGPGLAIMSSDGGGSCTTAPIALGSTNLVAYAVAYMP